MAALEASNSATSQQLSEREVEAERLSKEFDNYKLRAQSVLKQSKDQQVKVNFETFIAERIIQPLESFKNPHPALFKFIPHANKYPYKIRKTKLKYIKI